MGLTFSEQALQHADGLTFIAKDAASSAAVVVHVGQDDFEHLGFDGLKQIAEAKLAAGLLESDGSLCVGVGDLGEGRF